MKAGSLFSGIGGFELGLKQAGIQTAFSVEKDEMCRAVLKKRFPDTPTYDDVDTLNTIDLQPVDILVGGDPCQENSNARQHGKCVHPSKAESFLRIINAISPQWVIRENPSITRHDAKYTSQEFAWQLVRMQYVSIVIEISSACFTGQSRKRAFVIASTQYTAFRRLVSHLEKHRGDYPPYNGARPQVACLTTHPRRMESRDNYILENDGRIRILGVRERLCLQGFPSNWFDGFDFSMTRAAKMTGNAVSVPVVKWLAEAIVNSIKGHPTNDH